MAQLQQVFDATTVDPTQGGGSLPVGRHPFIISGSEITGTKDGANGMLVFELTIIDGPSKGVTGPYRLNLYHQNPQAAEIARKQLSALCHVTGTFQLQDTAQLHNKPFIGEVGLQKGEDAAQKGYTEMKKVFDINGNEPGKTPAQGQPQQQPAQPAFQQPAQQPAQQQQAAWGQQPPAAQQPAQQPAQQAAWGQQPPAQAAQQPAQQPAQQGTWGQGAPAGQQPAWGR